MSFAAIGLGASALGAGVQAVGALQTASAQAAQLKYQAGVAQMNAQVAAAEAVRYQQEGAVQAQEVGLRYAQTRGAQRAAYGAGNISGVTPARVMASTTAVGQEQEAITRANAAYKTYGAQVQQASDVAQAGADLAGAAQAQTAGGISALGTVLGGVGSVSTKYAQLGASFGSNPLTSGPTLASTFGLS